MHFYISIELRIVGILQILQPYSSSKLNHEIPLHNPNGMNSQRNMHMASLIIPMNLCEKILWLTVTWPFLSTLLLSLNTLWSLIFFMRFHKAETLNLFYCICSLIYSLFSFTAYYHLPNIDRIAHSRLWLQRVAHFPLPTKIKCWRTENNTCPVGGLQEHHVLWLYGQCMNKDSILRKFIINLNWRPSHQPWKSVLLKAF